MQSDRLDLRAGPVPYAAHNPAFWTCGSDPATVDINGAYARAGRTRAPPHQQVTYIDDTRPFEPTALGAHEG